MHHLATCPKVVGASAAMGVEVALAVGESTGEVGDEPPGSEAPTTGDHGAAKLRSSSSSSPLFLRKKRIDSSTGFVMVFGFWGTFCLLPIVFPF